MKIAYLATLDEATNAYFRLAELAGTVRRQLWSGLAMTPIMFLWIFLVIDDRSGGLIVGAASVSLYAVYHLTNYRKQIRARARKTLVQAQGTAEPVPATYELDENGLAFRKLGQELRFDWACVADLRETADAIEVLMRPTGIALIPKRIFKDPDEMQSWIRFIEAHRKPVGDSAPA